MFAKKAAAMLAVLALMSGSACDREDVNDVEEGVNQVENEVDQVDDDGKDD